MIWMGAPDMIVIARTCTLLGVKRNNAFAVGHGRRDWPLFDVAYYSIWQAYVHAIAGRGCIQDPLSNRRSCHLGAYGGSILAVGAPDV